MARFRCRLSGNIFEFTNEYDVKDMMEHPQYDLVEEVPEKVEIKKITKEKVIKKDKQ